MQEGQGGGVEKQESQTQFGEKEGWGGGRPGDQRVAQVSICKVRDLVGQYDEKKKNNNSSHSMTCSLLRRRQKNERERERAMCVLFCAAITFFFGPRAASHLAPNS